MNGWEWVIWGYGLAIGGLVIYAFALARRTRAVQARIEELDRA